MLADADARYWDRRAHAFDQALPRPGDHPGGPVDFETGRPLTPGADQSVIYSRLRAAAAEARSRAEELRANRCEEIW